jgi:two-component system NtrC family sensor kinase
VQAIDRDLNYSEPASIELEVIPDPRNHRIAQLEVELEERERARKEAERIQAAKMVSLRQLIAGVAHQMNNPVGTISSSNDVSSRAIDKIKERIAECDPQEIKEDGQLVRAFAALERMNEVNQVASAGIAEIVANLRSFVRLDESEWQLADIHKAMDSVLALMEPEFSGQIRVTRDYGDIPRIHCSPSSLNQVFMSMFRNACEAIEEAGEMHLRTSVQEEQVIIEISDTGVGIPSEDIDRIFDPGYTTKGVRVGVGLGLSICYQIVVDEHKGRIDVSSEPGKGTTFTITLPQHHDGKEKTQ